MRAGCQQRPSGPRGPEGASSAGTCCTIQNAVAAGDGSAGEVAGAKPAGLPLSALLWVRHLRVLQFLAPLSSSIFVYTQVYIYVLNTELRMLKYKMKTPEYFLSQTHWAMFQCCLNTGAWGLKLFLELNKILRRISTEL